MLFLTILLFVMVQQAQLWSNTSLLIHIHGGTLGNYAFLPHKAVAVQIGLARLGRYFPKNFVSAAWAGKMEYAPGASKGRVGKQGPTQISLTQQGMKRVVRIPAAI